MRTPSTTSIEPLESRRLMANATLTIDPSVSEMTVTATVDGTPLAAASAFTGNVAGTQDISVTRRGFRLTGGDLTVAEEDGTPITGGTFTDPSSLFTLTVADLSFDFTSLRTPIPEGRFTTRRVTGRLDGTAGLAGSSTIDLSTLPGARLDYAIGRVRTSSTSVRLIMAVDSTYTSTVTVLGTPRTLEVRLVGEIVGVGLFVRAASLAPLAKPDDSEPTSRVADDVLG